MISSSALDGPRWHRLATGAVLFLGAVIIGVALSAAAAFSEGVGLSTRIGLGAGGVSALTVAWWCARYWYAAFCEGRRAEPGRGAECLALAAALGRRGRGVRCHRGPRPGPRRQWGMVRARHRRGPGSARASSVCRAGVRGGGACAGLAAYDGSRAGVVAAAGGAVALPPRLGAHRLTSTALVGAGRSPYTRPEMTDFDVADADRDEAFAVWHAECARSRAVVDTLKSLDTRDTTGADPAGNGEAYSLRRVLPAEDRGVRPPQPPRRPAEGADRRRHGRAAGGRTRGRPEPRRLAPAGPARSRPAGPARRRTGPAHADEGDENSHGPLHSTADHRARRIQHQGA